MLTQDLENYVIYYKYTCIHVHYQLTSSLKSLPSSKRVWNIWADTLWDSEREQIKTSYHYFFKSIMEIGTTAVVGVVSKAVLWNNIVFHTFCFCTTRWHNLILLVYPQTFSLMIFPEGRTTKDTSKGLLCQHHLIISKRVWDKLTFS